ncbi:MAG: undecaprenyl/decaprenyl-phosphate alpha-N-acetylglucosaminyl 1-phosphate transferase [Alphaproteobacteria bacterium]|nr:undecaprenyl/decaprenyl-phosphate alpha-N-acetylglucosaminyl 1-phosphate transferase [Alphaproteobacteria bacterium]
MDVLPFFVSLIAALVLIPQFRKLALRAGLVDHPDARKQHETPVPPIGGLVIFPVFIIVSLLSGLESGSAADLFVALLVLMIMGAVDDQRPLNAWGKFFIQFAVAVLVVVAGGVQLHTLGNLFGLGPLEMGWMSAPFTVVALVLLINAVNLMDGVDGLAGGQGLIVLLWLGGAALLRGTLPLLMPILPLIGAMAGFLAYNLRYPSHPRASVFLGDAGSLCLGLCMGWFCISLSQVPSDIIEPIGVAWLLSLPIMDACAQFYRRVKEGRHPFSPDRGHFHHHFLDAGFSSGQTSMLILALVAIFGAVGVIGPLVLPLPVLTFTWSALLLTHIAMSRDPTLYVGVLRNIRKRVDKS